jgi:CRP-like cAMP-binding protein
MVSTSTFMDNGVSPFEVMVQISGAALRMEAAVLQEEFARGGALQHLLLRFAQSLYLQVSQTAACNQLHSFDQRLARWLLMTHDRTSSDTLELKQEFLSMMLGVERSRVTLAAISLQEMEIIK